MAPKAPKDPSGTVKPTAKKAAPKNPAPRSASSQPASQPLQPPNLLATQPLSLTSSQEEMPPPPPPYAGKKTHLRQSSNSSQGSQSSNGSRGASADGGGKTIINWASDRSSREDEDRSSLDVLLETLVEPGAWWRMKSSLKGPEMEGIRTHLKQLGFKDRSIESIRSKIKSIKAEFSKTYTTHFLDSGGSATAVDQSVTELVNKENPSFFYLFETMAESSHGVAPRYRWDSVSGTLVDKSGDAEEEDPNSDKDGDGDEDGDGGGGGGGGGGNIASSSAGLTARGKRTRDAVLRATGLDQENEEEEEDEETGSGLGGKGRGPKRSRTNDDGTFSIIDEDLDNDDDDSDTKPFLSRTPAARRSSERGSGKKPSNPTEVMARAIGSIAESAAESQRLQREIAAGKERRAGQKEEREERMMKLKEDAAFAERELSARNAAVQEMNAKTTTYGSLISSGMPHQQAMMIAFPELAMGGGGVGAMGGGGGAGGGGFRAPQQAQNFGGFAGGGGGPSQGGMDEDLI